MPEIPTWEVILFVYGTIATQQRISLNEPKGFRLPDPFYSDIEIRSFAFGVEARVTAYATTERLAYKTALLFFGQMLAALAVQINQPLYLSLYNRRTNLSETYNTRRIIQRNEWRDAFREARLLALSEATFLRALGWYQEGLYTEDPFDKFLAFWNSIEIVAGKYHPPIPEGNPTGSKSQVWESFKAIWGECSQWPIITGDKEWIDTQHETRSQIAHGTKPIDIETVETVLGKLETVQQVAHNFLISWRNKKLDPYIPSEFE